jgi:hypothetical protein
MIDNKKTIKISVVMIDGGFRENVFGAKYFSQQNFPEDDYEIIWVDYFDRIHPEISSNPKIKAIHLDKKGIYHSSYCFNMGIKKARGEVIIIPDADLIVMPDFLDRVWDLHRQYEKLVVYGYRYDEVKEGILESHDFKELEDKCVLKNPLNFGGCLTVRKRWLLQMNGFEQHDILRTGFHANGMLMSTRFKNMGLAIQWEPSLKLYHPWHPFTLAGSLEYRSQHRAIDWVKSNMLWQAIQGLDSAKNQSPPSGLKEILEEELDLLNNAILQQWGIGSISDFSENTTQPLPASVDTQKNFGFLLKIFSKIFGVTK